MPRRPSIQERLVASMRPGTLHGSLKNAGPVLPIERPETWRPGGGGGGGPIWNMSGPVAVITFDGWPAVSATTFSDWAATLTESGSTDTVVTLLKNGATQTTLTIDDGDTFASIIYPITVAPGDVLYAAVTSAGADAYGLVVRGE
jgi:hypothetical protein